jgi:hypothetical protein
MFGAQNGNFNHMDTVIDKKVLPPIQNNCRGPRHLLDRREYVNSLINHDAYLFAIDLVL